jgi:transposase
MAHYAGLDVSLESTSICVVDDSGTKIWQGTTSSQPAAICKALKRHAPELVKAGFETGPLSTWHWHEFKTIGLPAVCLDARHAKAALSLQVNKTDANDAHGLAQIVRTGWYREVEVKSIDAHLIRTLLIARAKLVEVRVKISNQLRGVLKTFGLLVGKAAGRGFEQRVRELAVGQVALQPIIDSLLSVWRCTCEQIQSLDRLIRAQSQSNEVCRRLMTAPGVGPVTALAYCAVIDDPARFKRSSTVGAYLGLTPRRYQSGEVDKAGRISKCGDAMLRSYLYEAANAILNRVSKWSKLKAWGMKLAKRVGAQKAKVAMARKLAVILHRMWSDGTDFRWSEAATA